MRFANDVILRLKQARPNTFSLKFMLKIRRLSTQDADFSVRFNNLLQQDQSAENNVRHTVEEIIKDIRENGDQALLAYTKKFDQVSAVQVSELEVSRQQMQSALTQIRDDQRQARQKMMMVMRWAKWLVR